MMEEFIEHVTAEGDRWDLLAWKYYGNATQYERIVAVNAHVAIAPTLPSGIVLHIPVIEETPETQTSQGGLPPWLR